MPAATVTQAAKSEREVRLLEALKKHILKERQRKKEEHEAEVEEERQRKEREARERQDVMTLGETREQIQKLDQKLKELKNQKQQLFLQLKKVLNEDENRKKQQQQKDSEIFPMHTLQPQPTPHAQIFLPPRQTHQQIMQKVNDSYRGGNSGLPNQAMKRGRSPSPPPPPQSYYKSAAYSPSPKHDDGRRGDVARVLWNKPTQYQSPPGTLFYQTTAAAPPPGSQPDSRAQPIIYPSYNPNLNMSLRPNYHIEIPQPPPSHTQSTHSSKSEPPPKTAQVYHINLDQPPPPVSLSQAQVPVSVPNVSTAPPHPSQHKQPPVGMEKMSERGAYHMEVKMDPDTVVYTPLMPGIPLHPTVMQMSSNPSQNSKAGGSITQGYPPPNRGSGHNQQPPPPMPGQPSQPQQIHYPRRLF